MALQQSISSLDIAAILLDDWERADLSSLSSHLAESDRLASSNDGCSLEGERRELLTGIAASIRRALMQGPNESAVDEMDTSVQLLRHLVRTQGYEFSS